MSKKRTAKADILKTFNIQIKQFLVEVINIFPKQDDIKSLNNIICTFCKFNPLKLIEIWNYYIAMPYMDMINKGDFNYFENKNYAKDLKDLQGNSEYVLTTFNKLRISISKLSQDKKMMAMKYIQILTKLSTIYFK